MDISAQTYHMLAPLQFSQYGSEKPCNPVIAYPFSFSIFACSPFLFPIIVSGSTPNDGTKAAFHSSPFKRNTQDWKTHLITVNLILN